MTTLLLKGSILTSTIGLALLCRTTLCPISRADDNSHRLVVGKHRVVLAARQLAINAGN
jgi:hypothetical protein